MTALPSRNIIRPWTRVCVFRAIFILYLYVNLCVENLLDNSEGHYTIIDITGDEMTKKEILLSCLTAQPGEFVSGEEISRRLNVTRTAVWQLINDLRQEGYDVVGKPKYGYKISESSDVLSAQGLEKLIQPSSPRIRVEVCDEVESTNQTLRERAERGEEAGLFFLARSQTKGRGRLGRSFFSPKDAGLYMSLLLRPEKVDAEKATRYTTLAAVAVCDAIEETTDLQPEVKLEPATNMAVSIMINSDKYKVWFEGYGDVGRDKNNLSGKAHIGKFVSPQDEIFGEAEVILDHVDWQFGAGYSRYWGKSMWSYTRRMPMGDNDYRLEYFLSPKWRLRAEHFSGEDRNEFGVRYRIHEFLSAEYVYGGKEFYMRIIGNL